MPFPPEAVSALGLPANASREQVLAAARAVKRAADREDARLASTARRDLETVRAIEAQYATDSESVDVESALQNADAEAWLRARGRELTEANLLVALAATQGEIAVDAQTIAVALDELGLELPPGSVAGDLAARVRELLAETNSGSSWYGFKRATRLAFMELVQALRSAP